MTTRIDSGLLALAKSVRAYFAANDVTATASLGWKQPTEQINQGPGRANRVVFIPSDPTGRGGKLAPTQQPGQRNFSSAPDARADTSVRSLYTWERFVIVSVWAVDATAPADEEKQIEAVEDLFEQTIRAVHAFAHNDARWGDVAWTTSPVEHVFGRELRAGLTYRHPMFDSPSGIAYPAPHLTPNLHGTSG
jgi:hypothetical protein